MNLDLGPCRKEIEFFKTNTPEPLHMKGRVPASVPFLERQHPSTQGGWPPLVPSLEFSRDLSCLWSCESFNEVHFFICNFETQSRLCKTKSEFKEGDLLG